MSCNLNCWLSSPVHTTPLGFQNKDDDLTVNPWSNQNQMMSFHLWSFESNEETEETEETEHIFSTLCSSSAEYILSSTYQFY